MTLDSLIQAFLDRDMMVPLVLSILTGALIGGERELQGKAAGLRTHTLVCFASCLLTLVGLRMAEWVSVLPADTQIVSDMSRMPHAIITGVGFLGAGVIFRDGASVQGLTTAASLWLTAALGIVFGTDMLELGVIGLLFAMLVLIAMRLLQRLVPQRTYLRIDILSQRHKALGAGPVASVLAQFGVRINTMSIATEAVGTQHRLVLLCQTNARPLGWLPLLEALMGLEGVIDVAIVPNEIEHLL